MSQAAEDHPVQEGGPSKGLAALVARGSSWQFAGQLAPLAANVFITPVIIAGFGIDRYGLFMLITVVGTILVAVDGGIGHAALRYFTIYAGTQDRTAITRLLTTALACAAAVTSVAFSALFIVTPWAMRLFTIPDQLFHEGVFLMRAQLIITCLALVRFQFTAILLAHQKFALNSSLLIMGHAIYVGGALLTVAQGGGLYGIAWTLLAQQILPTVLIIPSACRYLSRSAVGLLSWREAKEIARYAGYMQWTNLMLLGVQQSDALVVGGFLPVRQVAFYSAGSNFALQVKQVPFNALVPIQSVLGRAVGARGEEGARADFERLQRLWVVGTAGYGAVGIAAAWFGVTAWLGEDFAISGTIAVIMLAAYLASLLPAVLGVWTQVLGHPEINTRVVSVAALVNVALTLVLVTPFGVIGIVAATAISQLVGMILLLRLAGSRLTVPVRSFLQDVPALPAVVAAALVVGLEWVLRPFLPQGAAGLLLAGLAAAPGLAVYGVLALGPRALWALVRRGLGRPSGQGSGPLVGAVGSPGGGAQESS